MLTTSRYIFLTAIRDWLFIALFIAVLFAIGVSSFLGGTSLTEQQQMIIAYTSGSSRLIVLVGIIIFLCFHVRRSFENKEIDVILSRPISRPAFVFSYWLGFSVISILIIIPTTIALYFTSGANFTGLVLWSFSVICEALIVCAFALFISLILKSAVSAVLACFAFYFICRMMGFFIILMSNVHFPLFSVGGLTKNALFIISTVIPRFDMYGQSEWLVYGAEKFKNLWIFPLQTLIFVPFVLLMAISDLKRKQF